MTELHVEIERLRAKLDEREAEVRKLGDKLASIWTCINCGTRTDRVWPASTHPDSGPVCLACGPMGFELEQVKAKLTTFAAERDAALKRVQYLEALLIVAANGHDKEWDDPDTDPEDCSQCKYEGMREALREGRDIIAARKEGK